jgi:3-hydroxyacyl-[acyl-carrier-protein] dehydratase
MFAAMSTPSREQILEQVVTILRRDLKLGPDAAIPPDMPFFGSDIDLDSLDILLLVTSIEKQFGVKIPSDAVGKEVFQNVSTLVDYVHSQAAHDSAASAASSAPAALETDYLARLPHGDAFRFVTKVTSVREGETAEGVWSVSGSEAFFAAHFPGNPLVPGVLLAEALAQISGLAAPVTHGGSHGGMLAHLDVRFEKPVPPPAEIVLKSTFARQLGQLQQFDVAASVGGVVVASGTITLHRPQ